jgi:putative phosphoribosyl transferase
MQVLALSRDGIAVAANVAAAFGAPIDILCIKCSTIATAIEGCRARVDIERVLELGLHASEVTEHLRQLDTDIERMLALFRGHRPFPTLHERHVVLVDDVLSRAFIPAAQHVRELGAGRITFAVPLSTPSTLREVADMTDEVVCIAEPDRRGLEYSYSDAQHIGDLEALALLERSRLAGARVRLASALR